MMPFPYQTITGKFDATEEGEMGTLFWHASLYLSLASM